MSETISPPVEIKYVGLEKLDPNEELRVITVRMPRRLHQKLTDLAHTRCVSMNRLCCELIAETCDCVMPGEQA
jgi:hypothetical protein